MATKTLRRRLHHGDVDGRRNEQMDTSGYDGLNEPLLGDYNYRRHDEGYVRSSLEDWDDKDKEVHLHWSYIFSNLIAQWTQWIANIILGSGSVIGRFLPFPSGTWYGQDNTPISLSPLQEERLRNLRLRLEVQFDGSRSEHQEEIMGLKEMFRSIDTDNSGTLTFEELKSGLPKLGNLGIKISETEIHQLLEADSLRQLWRLAYPNREVPPLKSELWKEMGWQGQDPSTDFRGGGFISLENLIFFAKNYPNTFQLLLHKTEGKRAEWEYPFAVAGINLSFMLIQMLDLQSGFPASKAGVRFLELLGCDEKVFDELYCVAFRLLDAQWLAKRASYMEFNEVMKSTRTQLERQLTLEDVTSVKDLPAYSMLNS